MPRYDYSCGEHGDVELTLTVKEGQQPQHCEKCGQLLTRLPSAPGFALKGGCWAYDGYSGNNPQGVKERK